MDLASSIPTDSRGVIRRGLDTVAGLLPWGLGAALLTYLFSQNGGEDSILRRIENIPLIGTIATGIANLFTSLMNAGRRVINREGYEADRGMNAHIDNHRIFGMAARDAGGTPEQQADLANDLRSLVRSRIGQDTGMGMSVNEQAAITAGTALRTAIHDRIVEYQNRINPNLSRDPSSPERAPLEAIANRYADAISGAGGEAAYINPNTATGYVGWLYRTQQGVAAQGQFQSSQVGNLDIALAAAAPAAAAGVAPAPEAAPAAPGARPPAAAGRGA